MCACVYIHYIYIYIIYVYTYTFDSQNSFTWNPSDGHFQTPKMSQKPATPTRDMPTPSIVNGVHGAPLFWPRFTSFLSILHLQSFHHVHRQRLQSLPAWRWMARMGPQGHAPSSLVVIDFPGFRAASSPSYAWKATRPNIAALGHDKTCVVFF